MMMDKIPVGRPLSRDLAASDAELERLWSEGDLREARERARAIRQQRRDWHGRLAEMYARRAQEHTAKAAQI